MKSRNLMDSFNYAFQGIIYALKTQRNMQIHMTAAVLVLVMSLFFHLTRLELVLLIATISLVLVTEMINTAIEAAIDLMTDQYNIFAKIAKNVAAGAVLIAAINAVAVAYLLFFQHLNPLSKQVLEMVRQSAVHITFIALMVVIFVTIAAKAYFGRGTPMSGGMPSGHAAIAFATATAITFISNHILVASLSFILALLVSQSRIEGRIHNLLEVAAGALLGTLLTVLLFQLFL
jgi:diacylglycerol kinase (ATP)